MALAIDSMQTRGNMGRKFLELVEVFLLVNLWENVGGKSN